MATIDQIRLKIQERDYYLSSHAEDEMVDDYLERFNYCYGLRATGGHMICEFCEGDTVQKKVTRQHWLEEKLYIVENVNAEVCSQCGERYFHATTLDAIDRLLKTEHPVKQRIEVEVVSF